MKQRSEERTKGRILRQSDTRVSNRKGDKTKRKTNKK